MPRTPLLRPGRFFAERAPYLNLRTTIGLLLAVSVLTTAGVGTVGWLFAERLDVTTTVENDNRPPDWVCDGDHGATETDTLHSTPFGCGQPETRQLNVGALLWEKIVGLLPVVFFVTLLAPVVVAGVAHLLSSALGGEGPFGDTLAIAAWATVPALVQSLVAMSQLWMSLSRSTFGTDPSQIAATVERLTTTSPDGMLAVVVLTVTCWQGYIWHRGLTRALDLAPGTATTLVLVVSFFDFVLALAN